MFWHKIGANPTVLSVIQEGYRIPFISPPPPMFSTNNRSAILENAFVVESILDLLNSGRIVEKNEPSFVVNPLSVAYQASHKRRLILDLSRINKFLPKVHFKLDDWKIGIQFLSKNAHMFSFDLKSGYHHINICSEFQQYLGFSWIIDNVQRYFEFTVLPFGLSSAPLLFTKILKPLVTHWRASGILIAVYLDDGFCVIPATSKDNETNLSIAKVVSQHVKADLVGAGFVYNLEKSHWNPTTKIEWLGMSWDSALGTLKVVQRRVDKIMSTISEIKSSNCVTIRKLHSFVGQIISLSPVVGNLSRLTTRNCQIRIAQATHEDNVIKLEEACSSELSFWENNVSKRNMRSLFIPSKVNKIMCCDASAVGSGAVICNEFHTAHKNWTEQEAKTSSTWRELNTILFAISSFLPIISESKIKVYTDSQSAARIVEVGSMKLELHKLAMSIFNMCLSSKIVLEVEWIPRTINEQADYISRLVDTDDWIISHQLFKVISESWGPFTVDCFATFYNTKLPRFFSRFWNPGSSGTDAFAQNWSEENCLMVPPVVLIPSVLKHLYSCKSKGVLVCPQWPSSPFWPLLWSCFTPWIKDYKCFEGPDLLQLGRNKNSLLGSKQFNSPVCALCIDCKEQ